MAKSKITSARNGRAHDINFLLTVDPNQPRRDFELPRAPEHSVNLTDRQAARRLRIIGDAIDRCRTFPHRDFKTSGGPVCSALREVASKWIQRPGELKQSAKLYRVICDLELAITMPAHATHVEELSAVIDELRDLTGWTVAD